MIKDIYLSQGEYYFAEWLEDLKIKGLVLEYVYEPNPFILCEEIESEYILQKREGLKEYKKSKKLIHSIKYTTDFKITWSDKADGLLTYTDNKTYKKSVKDLIYHNNNISYVEIKPSFDYKNMTRYVKVKIAWVYNKYGIYIQIINPEKHFKKTFYPEAYKYTRATKKHRKKKINGEMINVETTHKFINSFI
jgi:hypothetical protein